MTLTTLVIHTEAWLQEELGAQRALLAALERIEAAARTGNGADLAERGQELEALLAPAGMRELRRNLLLQRLATNLGAPAGELTLTKLSARLVSAGIETQRLEGLRAELRGAVAATLRAGRRLAALSRYHRGVLEELCQLLTSGAPGSGTSGIGASGQEAHLVDARG
jgi:hypothetical protein